MRKEVKTYIKVVLNLLTAIVALLLIIYLVPRLISFFLPFIIGWIVSLIAAPIVKFFEDKFKIKRKAGSAVVIIVVIALVLFICYGVIYLLVNEIISFAQDLPYMWSALGGEIDRLGNSLMGVYDKLPKDIQNTVMTFIDQAKDYFANAATKIDLSSVGTVGNFVNKIPDIIMAIVMGLLSSYFFVAEKDYMNDISEKYVPNAIRLRADLVKRSIKSAFGGYFKAQFKIEIWVYLILVIGFLILGIRYSFFIALGIAFLDFLPVFGTGTVMIPWAIFKLIDGDYRMVIGLLIIWGLGQLVRQIIQPKIVGDSVGMASIPTLFLLFIGFKIRGVMGMIFAVPIGIIVLNLYDEGLFGQTIESFHILVAGFNNFRFIRDEDRQVVKAYEKTVTEEYVERIEKSEDETDAEESANASADAKNIPAWADAIGLDRLKSTWEDKIRGLISRNDYSEKDSSDEEEESSTYSEDD